MGEERKQIEICATPEYLGMDATSDDVEEFKNFVISFCQVRGMEAVFVDAINPVHDADEDRELREEIWEAFCNR